MSSRIHLLAHLISLYEKGHYIVLFHLKNAWDSVKNF